MTRRYVDALNKFSGFEDKAEQNIHVEPVLGGGGDRILKNAVFRFLLPMSSYLNDVNYESSGFMTISS